MTYPEHDKLAKISDESQNIGYFLDWLENETAYFIAEWEDSGPGSVDRGWPASVTINQLLARYFGIDQRKLDREKDAMIEAQWELNQRVAVDTTLE